MTGCHMLCVMPIGRSCSMPLQLSTQLDNFQHPSLSRCDIAVPPNHRGHASLLAEARGHRKAMPLPGGRP